MECIILAVAEKLAWGLVGALLGSWLQWKLSLFSRLWDALERSEWMN